MAAEVCELNRPAFCLRNLRQRVAHGIGNRPGHNLRFGFVAETGRPGQIAFLASESRGVGSHDVERTTMCQREQERAQGTTLRVETFRPLPQSQEDLLRDLLGAGVVADQATCEREDGLAMASQDLRHRRIIATADRLDECTVVNLVEVIPRHEEARLLSARHHTTVRGFGSLCDAPR